MKKILIVEDNPHKREKLFSLIKSLNNEYDIEDAHSFTSGWQLAQSGRFDLIFLDMSLPTFDKTAVSGGGDFRPFGGKEIARKLKRRKLNTKFIVITQYKSFSDNLNSSTFNSLKEEMLDDYSIECLGVLFYSNKSSDWKSELIEIVESI
jgi:CheY-like chemotaxis protein